MSRVIHVPMQQQSDFGHFHTMMVGGVTAKTEPPTNTPAPVDQLAAMARLYSNGIVQPFQGFGAEWPLHLRATFNEWVARYCTLPVLVQADHTSFGAGARLVFCDGYFRTEQYRAYLREQPKAHTFRINPEKGDFKHILEIDDWLRDKNLNGRHWIIGTGDQINVILIDDEDATKFALRWETQPVFG